MSKKELGRFLAKVLRHDPDLVGVSLDESGWVPLQELVDAINLTQPFSIKEVDIREVVDTHNYKRFDLKDGAIRARSKHSTSSVEYESSKPPNFLYHGTSFRHQSPLEKLGFQSNKGKYIRVFEFRQKARDDVKRRGVSQPMMVSIQALAAYQEAGEQFYKHEDNWYVHCVDGKYLSFNVLTELED